MKDWLILLCIGIIAVLAIRERDLWMPQKAAATASVLPASSSQKHDFAAVNPPGVRLVPDPSQTTDLANLVAQSQRLATAKYPALGVANTEINIRFNFRYKHLLENHSPRLQDPAWPLQLADECAQDSGVHPAAARSSTPPLVNPPKTVSLTAGSTSPVAPSAPALRVASPASAPAQTLVFHPTNAPGGLLLPVAGSAATPAPKPAGALPFVTLEAVNQKSANDFHYNGGYYDYGWYDISFRQSVGIAINVRNMSRDPAAVNVRWIFFARQGNKSERFIFGASGKEMDLASGQNASVNADSPMLQRREINDGWLGQRYLSGSKYEGWLVQLLERGSNRVIKQTGSTGYLEDLAKKTDFSALLDDYKSKLRAQ